MMELKKYKRKRIVPQGWKCIKLSDEFETSSGATPLTTEKEFYENGDIPWINSGELSSPYIYKATNFITQKGYESSSTKLYPIDTVLVAMYGATAGKASLLKIEACTNQAICAILPNPHYSSSFLKYNIDTLYEYLIGLSSGSARDNLSQVGIGELKLIMPKTKEEQERLVSILTCIDRKIELNRQINDNLEKMAKQLYDYWFVQFDFPDENGRPYKSSGGAMVWNEKLKREIPLNWIVLSVNNIASSIRGVSYAKEDMVDSNLGVLVLRGNNIQDNHLIYDNNAAYIPKTFVSEEQHIQPLDIIMTMSSGSKEHIGKCAMFQFASKDTFGAFLTKFTAKAHYAYLLFNLFNSQYFKEKIKSIACGTGINNLTNQTFDEIYMAVPQDNVLLEFDKRQSQIFSEIGLFEENNLKLTKLRDELLPLLMNGQVSLNYHLSDD
ncbi:restriction endonuclease subunit S [Marseilla massiliensis]|uniref:restriction endonuclease subunit S n=1 Tax=Marseilla massiliensis TaxID=1841864 RepID=UPI002012E232|nr:restriction endonuclease subunit S [Marseilla massiliensis]MCL1611746.1 restriction endonuclease subunit S [Marseilla massiliensis]